MTRHGYIQSRLAIHEAAHAAANFILGLEIYSIEIGETEGTVRHARSDDTYAWCLAKLAPRAYEECFGYEPSGDNWDEDQVMARLRREISPGSVPKARAVLGEAADKLVITARFDSLVRALSPIVNRDKCLTGERAEEILLEAALAQHSLMAKRSTARHGRETHARVGGRAIDPWYEVTDRRSGRVLYRGASRAAATTAQARAPGSMLVGSVYGGSDLAEDPDHPRAARSWGWRGHRTTLEMKGPPMVLHLLTDFDGRLGCAHTQMPQEARQWPARGERDPDDVGRSVPRA